MNRITELLCDCLKRNRSLLLFAAGSFLVNGTIFALYGILIEPLLYGAAVCSVFLLALLLADLLRQHSSLARWEMVASSPEPDLELLPEPRSLIEEKLAQLLHAMAAKLEQTALSDSRQRQEMLDYFTAWVHQIKTPIAVMKLGLADLEQTAPVNMELQRVERYVDMVLQYIRLGSGSSDLVVAEYSVDDMIRESVRRYAPQFVAKRLKLDYTPSGARIITDRKWYSCILDQLISNAVKYTAEGTIRICFEDDTLTVADTGVGILSEDIPRIFEKGYTGFNGRLGEKSSGLGLYLARKAAALLGVTLTVQSRAGEGSSFSLTQPRKNT